MAGRPAHDCSEAPDASPRGGELAARMETARVLIEEAFLGAGAILAEAVEGVGALIATLDGVTTMLGDDAVAATAHELGDAAAKIAALPQRQAERRGLVESMSRDCGALAQRIDEMRRSFGYMRAFTVNIKITAGGIASADGAFRLFAQEIAERIEDGHDELEAFDADVAALKVELVNTLAKGAEVAGRCGTLAGAVPQELDVSGRMMAEHHARMAAAAAAAGERARQIRKKVARTLGALQIGDITRQRIEHVQAGLALLQQTEEGLTAEARPRAAALIHALLRAQLDAALEAFDREIGEINANMASLAADAEALLELLGLACDNGDAAGPGRLEGLAGSLERALTLVSGIEAADEVVLDAARATARSAHALTARLATIRRMKSDVQYMAINTALKSSRIGEAGRPLSFIAVELRAQAALLESAAAAGVILLEGLTRATGALGAPDEGGADNAEGRPGSAGDALRTASRRIGDAAARTRADGASMAATGEAVVDLLHRSGGRLGRQSEIGDTLGEVVGGLEELSRSSQTCEPELRAPLGELLAKLGRAYTMAQERDVQHAFAQTWGLGSAAAAEPAAEPAELDDCLF